jgi:hypothetical protein
MKQPRREDTSFQREICARTVHESNIFNTSELVLSEKQIPRFIGNISSLESCSNSRMAVRCAREFAGCPKR